ncbi:MAG: response regulator [Planctomycetota bacterium]|jgi:DNA-binding NarL/FixJ family response regulator
MNYETSEPEITEIMNDKEEQYTTSGNKIRIMIVDGHPIVRQGLMQFINEQSGIGFCIGTENANQVLDAIRKRQVDLAIVDISLKNTNGVQLTEKIKLQSPNLPVLILKMHEETLYAKRASRAGDPKYIINDEATEQIIKAVRYIQSLLRSRIYGFTILVKTERSE